MGSFPGKVIGIILCFLLLVFAPLTIVTLVQNIRSERVMWNALTSYVDEIRDKGIIESSDYSEFVADLGASMINFDIMLSVQRKLIFPEQNGATGNFEIRYVTVGMWSSKTGGVLGDTGQILDAGDSIQVVLTPISRTSADNLLSSVFGIHMNRSPVSYAATARNSGRDY